jgi:pyruvate kinase
MPRALDALRVGHRVMLDDGKIACVCARVDARGAWVRVVECLGGAAGQKLRADKGVNLPDADITMDALPEDDARVLSFAAGGEGGVARVQMVGLSFVQRREDVERVRAAIAARAGDGDGARVGLVLKVETRAAFERLPELLLAAMAAPVAGVMIARGDLAVEVGYERLAEVQEELLWLCEAAHVPVIWATQVLERLAKSGAPTRAEITDAAMGQRAECVMLNKGPYLPRAVEVLGDILHRMEGHQEKKSAMMRPLGVATRYWSERGVRGAGSGP